MNTPEPETEIEIAAEADTVQDDHHHHDNDAKSGDNGSEAGSDQSAGTELLNTAAAKLRLSSRPGEDMSHYMCHVTGTKCVIFVCTEQYFLKYIFELIVMLMICDICSLFQDLLCLPWAHGWALG